MLLFILSILIQCPGRVFSVYVVNNLERGSGLIIDELEYSHPSQVWQEPLSFNFEGNQGMRANNVQIFQYIQII